MMCRWESPGVSADQPYLQEMRHRHKASSEALQSFDQSGRYQCRAYWKKSFAASISRCHAAVNAVLTRLAHAYKRTGCGNVRNLGIARNLTLLSILDFWQQGAMKKIGTLLLGPRASVRCDVQETGQSKRRTMDDQNRRTSSHTSIQDVSRKVSLQLECLTCFAGCQNL
jgi:hypothetical protein